MIRAMLFALVCLSGACGAPPTGGDRLGVDILFEQDSRMERYALTASNELQFAGGYAAREGEWSWSGPIDAAEGSSVRRIIKTSNWWQSPPVSSSIGDEQWTIRLAQSGRRTKFTLEGVNSSVSEVWRILQKAGRARLQADLEALPKPDIDRYMRRREAQQQSQESGGP